MQNLRKPIQWPTQWATICNDFNQYTDKIRNDPHNPLHWINRAKFFLNEYPEPKKQWPILAVGDAYKVYKFFCDAAFRMQNTMYPIREEELKVLKVRACDVLVAALLELGATKDARTYALSNITREYIQRLEANNMPLWKPQSYPWTPTHYNDREHYLWEIKEEFQALGMCLRPSTVGPPVRFNRGVFATRRFEEGEILLTEKTIKSSEPDTDMIWHVLDLAVEDLETSIRNGKAPRHLLDRPDVGALAASYHGTYSNFCMKTCILDYLEYFLRKSPKLMWNVDFDFWVLLTVERKCGTNSFSLDSTDDEGNKDNFSVISRLTSFFQHSCECNANWGEKDTADTMVVTASRTILEGEEIFVSYGTEKGLEERRAYMKKWIGADCECTRCVREARTIAEAAQRRMFESLIADEGSILQSELGISDGSSSTDKSDADSDTWTPEHVWVQLEGA